jgi:hypothetical protein
VDQVGDRARGGVQRNLRFLQTQTKEEVTMKVTVHYALLPVVDTSLRFVVKMVSPVQSSEDIGVIKAGSLHASEKTVPLMIESWIEDRYMVGSSDQIWDEVELVECDFSLVPKVKV